MILDVLENAQKYLTINEGFAKAFEFFSRPELDELSIGKYEIDGDRIYAMVSREQGRRKEEAQLEVHNKYIDIQMVLDGTDDMGWKPKSLCRKPTAAYDPDEDIQFFADETDVWLSVRRGVFVIFFPEDAHLPLISSGMLHKIVVKVAIAQG